MDLFVNGQERLSPRVASSCTAGRWACCAQALLDFWIDVREWIGPTCQPMPRCKSGASQHHFTAWSQHEQKAFYIPSAILATTSTRSTSGRASLQDSAAMQQRKPDRLVQHHPAMQPADREQRPQELEPTLRPSCSSSYRSWRAGPPSSGGR